MTRILRKQLTILSGALVVGGALMWESGATRAQDSGISAKGVVTVPIPRVKLSRDEAARGFVALLENWKELNSSSSREIPSVEALISSVSKKSTQDIGEALPPLLAKMAMQWREPQIQVNVQSQSADSATVTVEARTQPAPRPLILVREGDSWGVDVFETYARWNGIEGAAKAEAMAGLAATFARDRDNARRAACQSNLKQIGLGIAQYAQDYDERLPPARPWMDALMPYLKNEAVFSCPAVPQSKGFGFAYNSKISTKSLLTLGAVSQTISIYETSVSRRNAFGMGENPAFRHGGGANYAFVDGHVKWFDKTKIPSFNLKP